MNQKLKLILHNALISAIAVVCYSPGFLALYPNDPSVFRAGSSLFIGFMLLLGVGYGNYALLNGSPKKALYTDEDVQNIEQIYSILEKYKNGKFFGPIAQTVTDQLKRFQKSYERAKWEVDNKFTEGSMTWERYASVLESAQTTVLHEVVSMVNRMQLFDEAEYERLQFYKNDNIPDDIQERQIDVYKQNMSLIEDAVAKNEIMILRLDTLSVEISKTGTENNSEALLDEISKLTQEIKYYT